jgi:phosphoglucomutase/phosphomannomutase
MDSFTLAEAGIRALAFDDAVKERALHFLRQWLTDADFTAYRPQLEWLIRERQWTGLLDRFYQILPFGTGGRRGAVGIGPNRMNLWTLGASVQGHCDYLRQRFPGVEPLRVVLAYDVRRFEDKRRAYNPDLPNPVLHLSSRAFAEHAAGVYVANGVHVHILPADSPRYLATPELSFAIRMLGAHGGLNVSASHNPPDDNGGKFYDERGAQPVPPEDQIMADIVDQIQAIRHLPWTEAARTNRIHWLEDAAHEAYLDLCRRQSLLPPPKFDEIRVVFTPLHGVGSMTAMEVLTRQGFPIVPVTEQMKPDGHFPNVTKSPNPEVPESMDLAQRTAQECSADLILATDPDADRLGGMIPDCPDDAIDRYEEIVRSRWRFVTGHEFAALLTHFKLSQLSRQGNLPASPIVIKTAMTTSQVTLIARSFGAQVVEDLLVGFKYIADVLWNLEQHGRYEDVTGTPQDFIIGAEESHGLLVTPHIRDKDAGASALVAAELALFVKRQGRTVRGYLDALARQYGYFRNEIVTMVMTGIQGKQDMARMLDLLRAEPPRQIAGLPVTQFEDLQDETGRLGPFKGDTDRAARNFLWFTLGDRGRIALRPSGTEPKAKAYIEVCSPPCRPRLSAADWERSCREVDGLTQRLAEEFLRLALSLVGQPMPKEGVRLSR